MIIWSLVWGVSNFFLWKGVEGVSQLVPLMLIELQIRSAAWSPLFPSISHELPLDRISTFKPENVGFVSTWSSVDDEFDFHLNPFFPFSRCVAQFCENPFKSYCSYGMVWALHFSQVLGATWMVGKEERTLGTKSKRYWISDKSNNYIIYTYIYTIYVYNIQTHIVLAFASTI